MSRVPLPLSAVFVFSQSMSAQDWPQWRGPTRDCRIAAAPSAWPASYAPAWQVEVGEGYSSLVIRDATRVIKLVAKEPVEMRP